jgi:hypothetical protein
MILPLASRVIPVSVSNRPRMRPLLSRSTSRLPDPVSRYPMISNFPFRIGFVIIQASFGLCPTAVVGRGGLVVVQLDSIGSLMAFSFSSNMSRMEIMAALLSSTGKVLSVESSNVQSILPSAIRRRPDASDHRHWRTGRTAHDRTAAFGLGRCVARERPFRCPPSRASRRNDQKRLTCITRNVIVTADDTQLRLPGNRAAVQ